MALFVFGLVCLTALTGCLAGPGPHKHGAHVKGAHEEFRITVRVKSGGTDDPTWIIDNDTHSKDVQTILGLLKRIANVDGKPGAVTELPSLSGYRGMEVEYVTHQKSFTIPRCKFVKLEYLLVNLTAGNRMTARQKGHVFSVLKKCLLKQKAEAAAKKAADAEVIKKTKV